MWPILRAIKLKLPDGSDPHILDMCGVYQEAYASLVAAMDVPEEVALGNLQLLPSHPRCYPQIERSHKSKPGRRSLDMERIHRQLQHDKDDLERVTALLRAALPKIAEKLHEHTIVSRMNAACSMSHILPFILAPTGS